MFSWLTRWVSPSTATTSEPDPFDAPISQQNPETYGSGVGGQEEFDENMKEARDIISQLEGLVLKMETKRKTKRGGSTRGRHKRRAGSEEKQRKEKGKERERQRADGVNAAATTKTVSDSGSPLSSSASPASRSGVTTTTQSPKKPYLFTMPHVNRNEPIVHNGMTLMPGQTAWQGGEELRIDDGDDTTKLQAQPLRKSTPRKTGVGRALRAEDYVLDDTGEWVKMDENVEMSEKEKAQPRLFLIRYLNPNVTNKMAGKMRLVDGRWVPESDESSEGDDIDFDAFGDDEELNKWSEKDTYFPDLKEFDVGEDNLALWRRREAEHKNEMGCWGAPEKEPKRFLLDGLRQMYIIRVVDQANTRGRMWRQNKATTSPAKFPAPVVATAAVSRPGSSLPVNKLKSLEKFKDDGDFDEDLEFSGPISPRRPVEVQDGDEEDNFAEASPPASISDEDWGEDFATSPFKKLEAPSMALSGFEIGDDDEMDVDAANTGGLKDNHSSPPQQRMNQDVSGDRKANEEDENDDAEDWGDAFAEPDLSSKLSSTKLRLNLASIGDDDDIGDEEDGDDEFEDLRKRPTNTRPSHGDDEDDEEDWAMDDDDNGKPEIRQAAKNILKDLVIEDDESFEADDFGGAGPSLDRSRSGSFNTDETEDVWLMHNVGGIINSDARKSVNRK